MLELIFEEKKEIVYDGTQLSSHWIFTHYNVLGDALLVFRGPCEVKREKMVDLEDVIKGEQIKSLDMLHFLIEIFGNDLEKGVMWQRIFIIHLLERLKEELPQERFLRSGDDIYWLSKGKKKLNVSIATKSPISLLIHVGVNIDSKGAPVPAAGLKDLKLEPLVFAKKVAQSFKVEYEEIKRAALKAKPVR